MDWHGSVFPAVLLRRPKKTHSVNDEYESIKSKEGEMIEGEILYSEHYQKLSFKYFEKPSLILKL